MSREVLLDRRVDVWAKNTFPHQRMLFDALDILQARCMSSYSNVNLQVLSRFGPDPANNCSRTSL